MVPEATQATAGTTKVGGILEHLNFDPLADGRSCVTDSFHRRFPREIPPYAAFSFS